MKIVHKSLFKVPEITIKYWRCYKCEIEFRWKEGCLTREIIDIAGGTEVLCLKCSKKELDVKH